MFPGQGSQNSGMLERAAAFWSRGRAFLRDCSQKLSIEFPSGAEAELRSNRELQCAVFIANHCYMMGLHERGVVASWSLGMSLGEYNHLVHIGVLDVTDALALVAQRGALYDAHVGGGMLAVFPIELVRLESLIARARSHGTLQVANHNSPRQFVVSGTLSALDELQRLIENEDYAQTRFLNRDLPMHSSLFEAVARKFREPLAATPVRLPFAGKYLPNVLGDVFEVSHPDDVRELLSRHVAEPVQWARSIDLLVRELPSAEFVEVGTNTILCDLLKSGWRGARYMAVDVRSARARRIDQHGASGRKEVA
jgi:[acyl-carrier-protein] S-malonyltransferase